MLFKREPSVWLGLISALVALLNAFRVIHLDEVQTGLLLAFSSAVIAVAIALSVRPFKWPLLTGLAQAAIALVAGFVSVDQNIQGAILTAISVIVLFFNRQTVTPEASINHATAPRRKPTPYPTT